MRGHQAMLLAQRVLFVVSVLTLAVAVVHRLGVGMPVWMPSWGVPVLLAAAVGYLTNAIAISMMFKPFERVEWGRLFGTGFFKDGRWIALVSLGFWRQGLIPQNKQRIGNILSEEIPQRLLHSDELSQELGDQCVRLVHEHPELWDKLELQARRYLLEHQEEVAMLLAERLQPLLMQYVPKVLCASGVREMLGKGIERWLSSEDNQRMLAERLLAELGASLPSFRPTLLKAASDYIDELLARHMHLSALVGMFGGADTLLSLIDWERLEQRLAAMLRGEGVKRRVMTKLGELGEEGHEWLTEGDGMEKVTQVIQEAMSHHGGEGLQQALRGCVETVASDDTLWFWLRSTMLPLVATGLRDWLGSESGQDVLRDLLDMKGRIQSAVEAMNVREFHAMILRVVEEHLGAIQVLGYVLGGVAGLLL